METPETEQTRIIVVDDDNEEGVLFSEKIKELNLPHAIYTATSCSALFDMLAQNPLPHVIFMDINMPLPNGHECVKRLKAHPQYGHIPVIMYSISAAEQDIETSYAAGAHYYVVKPYAPQNLSHTLKRALTPDWRKPQPVAKREEFVIDVSYSD